MDKVNVMLAPPEVVCRFREHIQQHKYDFKDDRASGVMDYLYIAYIENQGRDPETIQQAFVDLNDYLEKVSLDDNNAIFGLVCRLCNLYEERAFKDGLQLGAYLILELQEK